MRPDAVLGGLACLVAAVGLFCATYLAVFADFGDTGFLGHLTPATCEVTSVRLEAEQCPQTAPDETIIRQGPCFHAVAELKVAVEGGTGTTSVDYQDPAWRFCLTTDECLSKAPEAGTVLSCLWNMQAYTVELQEEGEAVEDQGTPQWQVYAFYAIILGPIPFCVLMGVALLMSGVCEAGPLDTLLRKYRCDFQPGGGLPSNAPPRQAKRRMAQGPLAASKAQ